LPKVSPTPADAPPHGPSAFAGPIGNQKVAEEIAHHLLTSGQLSDYGIRVKYDKGTTTLRGQVASEEQMKTALRLAFDSPEVKRVVNELTVRSTEAAQPAEGVRKTAASPIGPAVPVASPLQPVPAGAQAPVVVPSAATPK
jgi:hypothetical protein